MFGEESEDGPPGCDGTTSAGGFIRSRRTREVNDRKSAPGDRGAGHGHHSVCSCTPPYTYMYIVSSGIRKNSISGDTHCGKPRRPPLHGAIPRHPKGHLSALP